MNCFIFHPFGHLTNKRCAEAQLEGRVREDTNTRRLSETKEAWMSGLNQRFTKPSFRKEP